MHDNREKIIKELLKSFGEVPDRKGLIDTPKRVIKSYEYLLSGYHENPKDLFTCFDNECYDQMIILKDIEFYSLCEHHLLPFFGKAHIAYIPDKKIIGISKLARILDIFSKRLQIQERLCAQVTECIQENLSPLGSACMIEAFHLCMKMRGVEKQNSIMTTSSLVGVFRKEEVRMEFLSMIGKK